MATIRRRGGKWQVQVRRKGFALKTRTFLSKKDADQWAVAQERSIDLHDPAAPKPIPANKLTLRELIDRYCRVVLPNKRSGRYESYLAAAIGRAEFTNKPAQDVTAADLANYRDRRLTVVRAGIVRRELGVLSHIYEVAKTEWGHSTLSNPVRVIRKPSNDPPRTRRLATGEWGRLSESLAKSKSPFIHAVAILALETGMRMGEILAAKHSDLDSEAGLLTIRLSKNGKPRIVPLSTEALATIAHRSQPSSDRLFPTTTGAIKQAWSHATKRAGITDLHFHDLRHEAISRFFERGLALPEVALISGHRDPRMLLRYTHLDVARIAHKLRESSTSTEGRISLGIGPADSQITASQRPSNQLGD